MVKMLTVLVSTISNSQVFLLKNVSSFCKCKSYSHCFSKNISAYAILVDHQRFNDMLTNNIVSFEQLGPGCLSVCFSARQIPSKNCLQIKESICSLLEIRSIFRRLDPFSEG